MANYQLLKSFKFGTIGRQRLADEQIEAEYQARINGYSTTTTLMIPRLVSKSLLELGMASGHSTSKALYPIFWITTPEMLQKVDTVSRLSASIKELLSSVPQVAVESYLRSLLTNEIFFTNEIEGVHTNPEEIGTIVWDVDNESTDKRRRLESTIRQYNTALKADQKQIKQLTDIRDIYDHLLAGEIEDTDLPDGTIFRNSFVYIGGNGVAVHLPPDKESDIVTALDQLIVFMNDDTYVPIEKAIVTHFMFENTHPFRDGNGRTGRFLLSSYLSKKLDPFTGLSISTSIHEQLQTYYKLFKDAGDIENRADVTHFLLGMLDIIISGQQDVITQLETRVQKLRENFERLQKKYPELDADTQSLLFILLQSKLFTNGPKNGIQDRELRAVAKEAGHVSRRRFAEIMSKLIDAGIIANVRKNPMQHAIRDELLK